MPVPMKLPYIGKKGKLIRTVPDAHRDSGCREGENCTGPGCRVKTGKTSDKKPACKH